MKEVIVLIGNYGSGKTELALNFAFQAANQGKKVELLDLDMVNTYFRLTDRSGLIKSKEIRLVSPNFVHSSVETLSLPAEVASAFALDWDTVIFDVGGDPAGATALGRYREDFDALPEGSLTVLNVVNTRRPMAGTPERLIHLMEGMERHSRQKVTGFVNNTNLARMANADDLRDGYEVVREASERSGRSGALHHRPPGPARAVPRRRARPQVHRRAHADTNLYAPRLGDLHPRRTVSLSAAWQ